jgi:hypothetical protein
MIHIKLMGDAVLVRQESRQLNYSLLRDSNVITFDDGTVLEIQYEEPMNNSEWLRPVFVLSKKGDKFINIEPASDIANFGDHLKTYALGRKFDIHQEEQERGSD